MRQHPAQIAVSVACAILGLLLGLFAGLALCLFLGVLLHPTGGVLIGGASLLLIPISGIAGIYYGAVWGYELGSNWFGYSLIQCQSCGYSLMGGAGEQCPECGYPISEEQIDLREAWKR